MKKIMALFLVVVIAFSCVACAKEKINADEVAQSLEGTWVSKKESKLGAFYYVLEFSDVQESAGNVQYLVSFEGAITNHMKGTFGIDKKNSGEIDVGYLTEIDSNGKESMLDDRSPKTYTYVLEESKIVKVIDDIGMEYIMVNGEHMEDNTVDTIESTEPTQPENPNVSVLTSAKWVEKTGDGSIVFEDDGTGTFVSADTTLDIQWEIDGNQVTMTYNYLGTRSSDFSLEQVDDSYTLTPVEGVKVYVLQE